VNGSPVQRRTDMFGLLAPTTLVDFRHRRADQRKEAETQQAYRYSTVRPPPQAVPAPAQSDSPI